MKNTLIPRLTTVAAVLSISLALSSCDTPEVVPVTTTTVTQETTPTLSSGYASTRVATPGGYSTRVVTPTSVVTPRTTTTRTTRTTLVPVDD